MTPTYWGKQPDEVRQLEFDISPALASGDSVLSVDVCKIYDSSDADVTDSMVPSSAAVSGNKVYVTVQGGTHGEYYWLELRVVTANADYIEDDLKIIVKDKKSV